MFLKKNQLIVTTNLHMHNRYLSIFWGEVFMNCFDSKLLY